MRNVCMQIHRRIVCLAFCCNTSECNLVGGSKREVESSWLGTKHPGQHVTFTVRSVSEEAKNWSDCLSW